VGWGKTELTAEVLEPDCRQGKKREEHYGKRCDRCWLLLVVTGLSRESTIDISEFRLTELPEHGFERIYFFDELSKQAVLRTL